MVACGLCARGLGEVLESVYTIESVRTPDSVNTFRQKPVLRGKPLREAGLEAEIVGHGIREATRSSVHLQRVTAEVSGALPL